MNLSSTYIPLLFALMCVGSGCASEVDEDVSRTKTTRMGILPAQTQQLRAQEWAVFRAKHPEMNEQDARHAFDTIQVMSAEQYDADTAAWAERRALANAWIKTQIEDVYSPETVNDSIVQAAIDAYAFGSGNPALVTASHLLIKNESFTTPEERRNALEAVRNDMMASGDLTDEALAKYAARLTRAGFKADHNADLTFPKREMQSFLGEQLSYRAVVEPFADAAFALSDDNRLSPVTETQFGYHIILYKSRTEEKKADPVKDRSFIVSKLVQQGRKMASAQAIQALLDDAKILVDDKRLQEIAGNPVQKQSPNESL